MSLPAGFATPDQAAAPHPLHVVTSAGFDAWRAAQPAAVQAWRQSGARRSAML